MPEETSKSLLYRFFIPGDRKLPGNFESRLFRLITLPNGTTKNTSPNRLDDLNVFMLPYLAGFTSPQFKDIAVSSGISTLEWLEFLKAKNINAGITATDLYVEAILRLKPSGLSILCDSNSNPLLVEAGRSFFRTSFPKGSIRYRWGKLISKLIKMLFIPGMAATELRNSQQMNPGVFPVKLLSHAFRTPNEISFKEEDILLPPEKNETGKYDVIRAANILNKVYFSDSQLELILSNLANQLKPGGLLVICKTDDSGCNNASLFELNIDKFKLLKNLNAGSEIENIVRQFNKKQ